MRLVVFFLTVLPLSAQTVHKVDSVSIVVSDADRILPFYTSVLDFEKVSDSRINNSTRVVRLRLGAEFIDLIDYLTEDGRPIPADSRSNDRWFQHVAIIVSDMDAAYTRLRAHKVKHASSGPQRLPDWNPNASGIKAFYFKDPDQHVLEVLQFPTGKGDAKWQNKDRLFLGIDHTAIVVEDTDRSIAYYRDKLGMRVTGNSENYGTEQERLNGVFGARLRITALRAASGPGIELLEYIAPGDGRPYPEDVRPHDLLHWQTRLVIREESLSGNAADPDGHKLRFVAEGRTR